MKKDFTLETDRLVIKRLSDLDYDKVCTLLRDPEVVRYLGSGQPKDEAEIRKLFDIMMEHQRKHGYTLCPTYEMGSGSFIGFAGLVHLELDDSNPEIEVGYWLSPEFWGKGYATEVTKACIRWAFVNLPIDYVVGITHPENIPSQNVLKKAGLGFVGKSTYRGRDVKRFEIYRRNTDFNVQSPR